MKFQIYKTKLGQQFFFINNLANWLPSFKERYNRFWFKIGGPIKQEEKNVLKEVTPILKNYTNRNFKFKPDYLDILFYEDKKPSLVWREITKLVSSKELEVLKRTFKILEPRFKEIWGRDEPFIKRTIKNLKIAVKISSYEQILSKLSTFYHIKKPSSKQVLKIFFIFVPIKKGGGGKALKKNLILLERGPLKQRSKEMANALAVIVHEIIHACFESKYFLPLLKRFIKRKGLQKKNIKFDNITFGIEKLFRELTTSLLTPEGYLAEKYFGLKVNKRYQDFLKTPKKFFKFEGLRRYTAFHLYSLVRNYIENGKKIDNFYLQKILLTLQKFKKLKNN